MKKEKHCTGINAKESAKFKMILLAITNIHGEVPDVVIPLEEADKPLTANVEITNGKAKFVADGITKLEGYFIFPSGTSQITLDINLHNGWPDLSKEGETQMELAFDDHTVNFHFSKSHGLNHVYIKARETTKLLYNGPLQRVFLVISLDGTVGVKDQPDK
uniref:Galectin n=1 Tax=Panagrolaimus sp. JU765 TaxID=591449 RepID=A0AC34R7U9_9BILA